MVAFSNAMSYAELKCWLTERPKVKKLGEKPPPKRELLSLEQIEHVLSKCSPAITKNSKLLRNYVRFLYMSGAREQEALKTRKTDVGPNCATVTIGSKGDTKNSGYRTIDCSAELQKLLQEILDELPPDTSFLFPSPQRGEKDIPAKTLRESFKLVRTAAGIPWLGFHDFRHFFCSTCVMACIDFMTIAYWIGQKDGGILIGKVYGHLADEHKKRAAAKLSFS